MFQKLTHDQRIFVSNILRRVENQTESELIFFTGGPGVGKSEALKALDYGMDSIYSNLR